MPKIVKPVRDVPLESEILRDVRKWLSEQPDVRVWRNAAGLFKVIGEDGQIRKMKTGLTDGASDLIGIIRLPAYEPPGVNGGYQRERVVARFLAIELKQPGKKPTDDQTRFLDTVCKDGGVTFWADNLGTVQDMIAKARRWEI